MPNRPTPAKIGAEDWTGSAPKLRAKNMPFYAMVRRAYELLPKVWNCSIDSNSNEVLFFKHNRSTLSMSPLLSDIDNSIFIAKLLDCLRKNNMAVAVYSVPGLAYGVTIKVQISPEEHYVLQGYGESIIVALLRSLFYLKDPLE